jgi:hypothetical protein
MWLKLVALALMLSSEPTRSQNPDTEVSRRVSYFVTIKKLALIYRHLGR